jgi:periplasmic divalent cation tolerance protein
MTAAALLVYVACATTAEAAAIGEQAVTARLAACANILPAMQSLYHWQGKLMRAEEAVLLLKTLPAHFAALSQLISAQHSYVTPAIIAMPITHSTPACLAWLQDETLATP